VIALGIVGWTTYARMVRSKILSIKESDYIEAGYSIGESTFSIITRYIIPNAIPTAIVMISIMMPTALIASATLSFLGVGAPPGYADWGQMISFARNWIIGAQGNPLTYWYTLMIPGIAILLFSLSWNLIGDAFRDILDPKLQK